MTIEILRADMVKAMKEKDKFLKDVVSSLIAAVKKVAIDERAIITKDILSRNDDVSNDKYIKEYYERWLNIKEE